jgi:acetyl esterase
MTQISLPPRTRRRRPPVAALNLGSKLTATTLPLIPVGVQRRLAGAPVQIDGNTLDPSLRLLTRALRMAGVTSLVLDEDDIGDSREAMRSLCIALGGPAAPVTVEPVVIPGLHDGQPSVPARHYLPPREGPAPLLVFLHGGGYLLGDLDAYDSVCRRISHDAGVHVLSVDYRLAPEHPAPAATDDAWAAWVWAVDHASDLGADPNRVAVAGDSAGGALAAVVAQRARDEDATPPVLQLLIYPWTDLMAPSRSRALFAEGFVLTQRDLDFCAVTYLGDSGISPSDPLVSPLRAESLAGLAPAVVFTAGFDPLRDEGQRYAAALTDAGVSCEHHGMDSLLHGFINFRLLGGACARAIDQVTSVVRTHM